MKKHNRVPKASERGSMAEVYEKYRSLKRNVRDNAAKSIQRLVRGFLTRRSLHIQSGRGKKLVNRLFITPLSGDSGQLASSPAGLSIIMNNGLAGSSSSGGQSAAHKRKMNESVNSGGAGASTGAGRPFGSNDSGEEDSVHKMPADVFAKFRDLWGQKHELKRRLKKFDDDFNAQHNRQPSKAEKEVMRPMYDKYHEVKSTLDALKAEIEASSEPIPDSLLALLGPSEKPKKSASGGSTPSSINFPNDDISGRDVMLGEPLRISMLRFSPDNSYMN
jgi:hypothetical protein